jgi:hypothetical protein
MSSLRKKFPNCFVRVEAKHMPTVICGYRMELFENQIESWVEEYENDPPLTTDS